MAQLRLHLKPLGHPSICGLYLLFLSQTLCSVNLIFLIFYFLCVLILLQPLKRRVFQKEDFLILPKVINTAKSAGFCYGVKKAVETAKKLKADNPTKNIYILGALIHNSQVINELEALGIHTVDKLPENPVNAICIIRTHGEAPEVIDEIKSMGYEVVDLTCPDVKKVQMKGVDLAKDGFHVVIIGKENHPEVIAIRANILKISKNVYVINSLEDVEKCSAILRNKKIGVVIQTTQPLNHVQPIIFKLQELSQELKIENTICPSTRNRQKEAAELAQNSDLMVVIGSKESANTTHLAHLCSEITKTIHIETSDEIENYMDLIKNSNTISVTAGASTPKSLIDSVLTKIEKGE